MEDFPPTDFHSATLVEGDIFIIGRLGYPDQRVLGTTPVYRLALDSMLITPVATRGEPPGWIYSHAATLASDGQSIVVSGGERWLGDDRSLGENIDSWSLNTLTGEWKRLTKHDWQRWTMMRCDRERSRLWAARHARWCHDHAYLELESGWKYDDEPDFAALEMLYRLDDDAPVPVEEKDLNTFSVVIDGLTVRFKEQGFWVEAIVEGRLAKERLEAFQKRTLALLGRIEGSECEIEGCTSSS